MRWQPLVTLSLLTLVGGFAGYCGWYATAPGAAISPDSTAYIGAARSLLAGEGLTVRGMPLTHYPPLLSVLLALGGMFGPDPAVVARWLNVGLLGASVFLIGYAIHRTTGAVWAAGLAAALTLAAGDIVEVHTWAWSEPLLLCFGLAGLLQLSLYFRDEKFWRLAVAGACLALALLARYAAIPLIGTAVLGVLLFRRGKFGRRCGDALILALISCAPLGLWMVRNWWVAGTPANRPLHVHWITARHFNAARATVTRWFHFGPGKMPVEQQTLILWVGLGVLLALLGVLIWKTVRPNRGADGKPQPPHLAWLWLIFALSYFGFLVVSISLFDFNTPLDRRILCPLHLALIGFVVYVLHTGYMAYRWTRWVGVALLLAGAWSLWPQGKKLQKTLTTYHTTARGYASKKWRECQFLERIRQWPDVPIYMNEVVGTTYHSGRLIQSVPARRNSVTAQPNAKLAEELQQMKEDLTHRGGVFIHLKMGGWRGTYIPREELFRELNLKSVEKTPEAEVFKILP